MAPEQARDPEGRFAAQTDEERYEQTLTPIEPRPEAQEADTEADRERQYREAKGREVGAAPTPFKVTPEPAVAPKPAVVIALDADGVADLPADMKIRYRADGQDEVLTAGELQARGSRTSVFTKRMEKVARDREEVERARAEVERERLLVERLVGGSRGIATPGLNAPQSGGWGGSADPANAGMTREEPMYGTAYPPPARQPRSPYGDRDEDEDDYRVARQMQTMGGRLDRLEMENRRLAEQAQRSANDREQERLISALPDIHPGFDRNVVEDVFYRLPENEQAYYRAYVPKATAYEVLWSRYKATSAPAASAQESPSATVPAPPFQEGGETQIPVIPPQAVPSEMPQDEDGQVAALEAYNEATAIGRRR